MNQVHKEPLEKVENALPNRTDPSIEIFGTEGIPEQAQTDHTQRVTDQYFRDAADRQALTGNIQPGSKTQRLPKRPKLDEQGDLKERLKAYVAQKSGAHLQDYPMQDVSTQNGFQQSYASGVPPYQRPPAGQAPYAFPPSSASPGQTSGIGRPPGQGLPPPGTLQDPPLQAGGAQPGLIVPQSQGDIPMPDVPAQTADDSGRKVKKERGIKMVYADERISPEEKMATMSKYAYQPAGR